MSRRDPTTWMWAEACEVLERAERLHRQFFQLGASLALRPRWEPPVDMFETAAHLWLVVALPGVAPEQIEIRLDAGTLMVAAERSLPAELRTAAIHRLEIPHGRFERRIELPPGRYELERQGVVNGCLVVSLRRPGRRDDRS